MNIRKLAIVAIMLLGAGNVLAATLSVPLEYPTIQTAIDTAVAGDEVFIANGTYREPITLKSGVVLRGESLTGTILQNPGPQYMIWATDVSGAAVTSLTMENDLSGSTYGALMAFSSVDFDNVIVRGFSNGLFFRGGIYNQSYVGTVAPQTPTISNALFQNNGTGIYLRTGVDATVTNSVFQNNSGSAIYYRDYNYGSVTNSSFSNNGTGVYIFRRSEPLIEGNIVTENGTGISTAWYSRAQIQKNVIADNTNFGIATYSLSSPRIFNNIVSGNGREGIWVFYNFPQIYNNTIINNSFSGIRTEWFGSPYMLNNIIAYNAEWGINDSFDHSPPNPGYLGRGTIYYSNVFGNALGDISPNINGNIGNLNTDPLFRDYANDDLQLAVGSPCIDSGNPDVSFNDPDGTRNDMGAYGGPNAMPGSDPTPQEIVEEAQTQIIVLPADAFKNEADGRKEELELKLDEILLLIDQGDAETDPLLQDEFYRDALNKLKNDLLKKADGHFGGKLNNDWITTYEAQSIVYPILVDLINEVEALLAL